MESNGVALARQAATAARAERAAQEAAMRPVRKYRGVQKRGHRYGASIWDRDARRSIWLGSYATPEEAAYAYDAAARRIQGAWAKPNFPEPSATPVAPGQQVVVHAPPVREAGSTATVPVHVNLALAQAWRAVSAAPARNSSQLPTPLQQPSAPLLHWATPPTAAPATQRHHQRVPATSFFSNQFAPLTLIERLFRLPGSAAGATVPNATGLYRPFPAIPGGYMPVTLNELVINAPTSSSELSSTDPPSSAAAVPRRRRLAISPAMALDHGTVVGDNFSNEGASSSVASTSGW